MPLSRRATMIDGFTSVQIAREAARRRGNGKGRESEPAPHDTQTLSPRIGARVKHTALPDRHPIFCYECRYEFVLTGLLRRTICPRCRTELDAETVIVDHPFVGARLRTIGHVHVRSGVVLEGVTVTAGTLLVEGDVRRSRIHCRALHVGPGGQIDPAQVACVNLVVRESAVFRPQTPVRCETVELRGTLEGHVLAERVWIRAGGTAVGHVHTAHLVVEEGGGLRASIRATPNGWALDTAQAEHQNGTHHDNGKTRTRKRA